jgi:hypothetical protein
MKKNEKFNESISYLLGCICGRGHIFKEDKKIIIEFSHKNETILGIAHCLKCGGLATERKINNPEKKLFCKKCFCEVEKSVKKEYEQRKSTICSLKEIIIPFLELQLINCTFDIIGNDFMTYLIIDFNKEIDLFDNIHFELNYKSGFDSFEIPKLIFSSDKECKIEFINGLIDTSGFFNSGGWLNRTGKNGEGRMRGYFQIVRNWTLPVQICNFLSEEFNLSIQTIDWGHPNTRDSNMKDYYDSNPLSWSREHQVKFFPEYYKIFKIRIKHKEKMFNELCEHNNSVGFTDKDNCSPPSVINLSKVKPTHFGEKDKRLPIQIRKHHDSYCQICYNMGCKIIKKAIEESKNKELFYLTGIDNETNVEEKKIEYNKKSNELSETIQKNNKNKLTNKLKKIEIKIRTNPEQKLYKPLTEYYEKYLNRKYVTISKVHDTSAFYLDKFIIQNDLFDEYKFCADYKIKPDIVGFIKKERNIAFMEVKANQLILQDIGQLLGYCLVAQPLEAILVSPKTPSLSLIKILKTNNELLKYSNEKRIEIATWKNNKLEFLKY